MVDQVHVQCSIVGHVTRMLFDTGSAVTLVREDVLKNVKSGNSGQIGGACHFCNSSKWGEIGH